jgi:hypothetical protein
MKVRIFTVLALITMLFAGFAPSAAFAQAYTTSFTTSITYQNVGADTATVSVLFYETPSDTSPIEIPQPDLAAGAGTSLFIGNLTDISSGFQGSAIMQSNQPLLATLVQIPQNSTTVLNRPLSNGFSDGGDTALIATVLKNTFDANTMFSVQNIDSVAEDFTIKFFDTSANNVHTITQNNVQPGAAFYVDAGQEAGLGASFNGSVVATANGKIVASAMELHIVGPEAYAFEGVGSGATTFYMPSALCDAFGGQNSFYAVQNTDLSNSTNVTVNYSNGKTDTKAIGPGAKASFAACNASGMPTGFSGSATVESDATPIIAIGKVQGTGLSTAFVGQSSGTSKVALPYVRWATDTDWNAKTGQRVFIAIQNIGSSDLAAGDVVVHYIDRNGTELATDILAAIPVGGKVNSNANKAGLAEFGYYHPGFGGGAIVEGPAGSQLAVIARVQTSLTPSTAVAEDYNGMAAP